MQILKSISLLILCLFFMLLNPGQTEAHIGGGPPFLKANGKYVPANQYYQGDTLLNVAQDLPIDNFIVKQPIKFEIDLDQMQKQTTIPPEQVQQLEFRWSWADGNTFQNQDKNYASGSTYTRTFSQPGTSLLITEARAPGDDQWILIDTTQVNVVPNSSYITPQVTIHVGTQDNNAQKAVILYSDAKVDKSSAKNIYLWDFNDGKTYHGSSVTRTFADVNKYGIATIYNRIIDGNGIMTDVGFTAENAENTLHFAPFGNMKSMPVKLETYSDVSALTKQNTGNAAPTKNIILLSAAGVFIIIFIVIAWLLLGKK
jgi:hypothetical protein